MIEIIKPGKTNYTKTCQKCECEFSYDLNDLIEKDSIEGIYCPCCHNFIPHLGFNIKL